MKSLHTRLDPQKDAVLKVTGIFGRWRAMQVFEVKDYLCFNDWLKEVTGDENFGLNPKISLNGRGSLGDQVVAAFIQTVLTLKDQVKALREENEYLKRQLENDGSKEELQTLAVLQVCEV